MKREDFNEYLIKSYPLLFKNAKDPQQSMMIYGAEIDEGWQQLVLDLCDCINEYAKGNSKQVNEHLEVVQIKEKFGGLRFYMHGTSELMLGMIWFAEHQSFHICEKCGKRGELRTDLGWHKTLCDNHYEKQLIVLKSRGNKNERKKN